MAARNARKAHPPARITRAVKPIGPGERIAVAQMASGLVLGRPVMRSPGFQRPRFLSNAIRSNRFRTLRLLPATDAARKLRCCDIKTRGRLRLNAGRVPSVSPLPHAHPGRREGLHTTDPGFAATLKKCPRSLRTRFRSRTPPKARRHFECSRHGETEGKRLFWGSLNSARRNRNGAFAVHGSDGLIHAPNPHLIQWPREVRAPNSIVPPVGAPNTPSCEGRAGPRCIAPFSAGRIWVDFRVGAGAGGAFRGLVWGKRIERRTPGAFNALSGVFLV